MNENIIVAITKLNEIVTDIDKDDTCFLDIKDTVEEVIALLKAKDINVPTKWVSVKDRLPDKSGYYLILSNTRDARIWSYSVKHKAFNAFDLLEDARYALPVTYWMPLPEPPKEDEP